MANRKL
ncbi:0655c4a6-b406-457f-801a-babeb6521d20 [Thermothielavioides terrestris]|nr:0655c4a6-b406-457f-801a-babeb6521d20 [Thermothielavioides terrestris]